jgi:diguanylate cyclase (GGDEF)-like protein/PAS domain S-box-containing protein
MHPNQPTALNKESSRQAPILVNFFIWAAIGIAFLSLVGWLSDVRVLAGQWGNLVPIAPLSALLIFLFGTALFSYIRWPEKLISKIFIFVAMSIVSFSVLILLIQYVTGINLGIESIFLGTPEYLGQTPIGRMSHMTALTFLLEGAAFLILLFAPNRSKALTVALLFNFCTMLINFIILIGYTYGAPLLYGGATVPVSLFAAIAFELFGFVLFRLLQPGIPWLQRWNRKTFRGMLLRAFLPFILIFTLLEGWVNAIFGPSLIIPALFHSISALVAGGLSVVIIAWISDRTGAAFETAQAQINNLARFPEENFNPVIRVGNDGRLIYANPSSKNLLDLWNCLKPGDMLPDIQVQLIKACFVNGVIQREEVTSGDIVYELVYTPIHGEDYLNIYGSDITYRIKAEKWLLESEERFRSLFENSPLPLWEQDFSAVKKRLDELKAEGVTDMHAYLESHPQEVTDCISMIKIMDINNAAVKCYKAKDKEDLKNNLSRILSPESYSDFNKELEAVSEGKTKFTWESHNLTLTGEPIDVNLYWSAVPGYESDLSKVFVSIVDITERKQAEIKLQESEALFKSSFESTISGISILGSDGKFIRVNNQLCKILGYKEAELLQLHFSDITYVEDKEIGTNILKALISGEQDSARYEKRYVKKDGSIIWVFISTAAIRDIQGNFKYFVSYTQDITSRKEAEKEIMVNNERLLVLTEILQHQSEKTQEFLDYALEKALYITKSKLGYIYFYDEVKREFTLNTWSREVMKECSLQDPQRVYELDKTGVWGEAVRQRKPIVMNDFQASDPLKKGYPDGHAHLNNFMTVPVIKNEKIVAVVGVANKPGDYGNTDVLQLALLMGSVWNIVEQRLAEAALRDSESEMRALFATMKDVVIVYSKEGCYLKIATTDSPLLFRPPEELLGKSIYEILPKVDADRFVRHIKTVLKTQKTKHIEYSMKIDRRVIWFDASVTPLQEDSVMWVARDITERKLLEDESRFIGIHDKLTSLYNRTYYEEALSRLEKSRHFPVSIFMFDLDDLKTTNDTKGHAAGDHLLKRTADVLLQSFRSEDMVARIGGDEFAVILPSTNEAAAQLALQRVSHFLELNNMNNIDNELKISIGSATCIKPGSLSKTIKLADSRMYQNKRSKLDPRKIEIKNRQPLK